jgi:hypothetical protein
MIASQIRNCCDVKRWIPACAGMTEEDIRCFRNSGITDKNTKITNEIIKLLFFIIARSTA